MVSNHRTASMNSLTKFFSKLADAPSIVAVGALVAAVLLAQRKWRIAVVGDNKRSSMKRETLKNRSGLHMRHGRTTKN